MPFSFGPRELARGQLTGEAGTGHCRECWNLVAMEMSVASDDACTLRSEDVCLGSSMLRCPAPGRAVVSD